MARQRIIFPFFGQRLDTRGWCVLHRQRPQAASILHELQARGAQRLLDRWQQEASQCGNPFRAMYIDTHWVRPLAGQT